MKPVLMDNHYGWMSSFIPALNENCDEKLSDDAWLKQGINQLYQELLTHPSFDRARQIVQDHILTSDSPSHWLPLLDTAKLKVGLFGLYRFAHVPLHDHPGAHGAQLVIAGRIYLRQYDLLSDSDTDDHLVKLSKVTDHAIGIGESATYTSRLRNLHDIHALSSRCILLSVIVNPYEETDRSWFFPVSCFGQEKNEYYRRLKSINRSVSTQHNL